jgi:hypothetical protein
MEMHTVDNNQRPLFLDTPELVDVKNKFIQLKTQRISLTVIEISVTFSHLYTKKRIAEQYEGYEPEQLRDMIWDWAVEFEDKYGHITEPEEFEKVSELGARFGYIESIIQFTHNKLQESGWLR